MNINYRVVYKLFNIYVKFVITNFDINFVSESLWGSGNPRCQVVKTAGHRVEGEGLILEWGGLVLGSMEEKFRTSLKYALPQSTAEVQICSCSDKIRIANMWICRCRATFLFFKLADLKLRTAEKVVIADMRICSSATFHYKIADMQLWKWFL
jgi:hypothetical protein